MTSLIIRNDADLSASIAKEAHAARELALEKSALIGKVTCAEEQLLAVEAQKTIKSLLNEVEASRKAAKEPVLFYGRRIDETAKQFCDELKVEELRISRLAADFQALELGRIRAAQAAENERLSALERERQAALAAVKTHDEFDKVNETFDIRAAEEVPPTPKPPARIEGQIVREDWKITVEDSRRLAWFHPHCVIVKTLLSEIKQMLNAGMKVEGVKAEREIKSGVRI